MMVVVTTPEMSPVMKPRMFVSGNGRDVAVAVGEEDSASS